MAKVFSNVKGRSFQLAGFGEASEEAPALVPDDVAAGLVDELERGTQQKRFRVEFDAPRAAAPRVNAAADKEQKKAAPSSGEKE